MTARDAFEACLIELNKVQAPALLLKDFVYLFNKGIQLYFNLKYNTFEINQQSTDDLRVLANSIKIEQGKGLSLHTEGGEKSTFLDSYDCILPKDYVHILNVVCEFRDNKPTSRCGKGSPSVITQGASKLDTNQWPSVISNYYMRPSIRRPYYYIINIQGQDDPDTQYYDGAENRVQDKVSGQRYGNSSIPIMQIKYGNDMARYTLQAVYVDYLRAPKYVKIDQNILDKVEDTSDVLEFPDYVIYEIINSIVRLILENASDQRIQTQPVVSQSIATMAEAK